MRSDKFESDSPNLKQNVDRSEKQRVKLHERFITAPPCDH